MLKHIAPVSAALLLTTALALAQTTTPPGAGPAATGTTNASPPPGASAPAQGSSEFQAIQRMKVPLAQAIDTAESQGQGRAIGAEFEDDGPHYEIKVVMGDGRLMEYHINADTGQVIKSENQPIERYFTRLSPADFQNARTSLKDAITIAEQRLGGGARAVEAEVEREGDTVVYEIEVINAERSQEIKIDGNGQVVSTD